MARTNRKETSLYQEAKTGLSSLTKQMAVVGVGFLVVLLLTGGHPPAWIVGFSFFSSTLFVAWSEQNRLTQLRSTISDELVSETPKSLPSSKTQQVDFYLNGRVEKNVSEEIARSSLRNSNQKALAKLKELEVEVAQQIEEIGAESQLSEKALAKLRGIEDQIHQKIKDVEMD